MAMSIPPEGEPYQGDERQSEFRSLRKANLARVFGNSGFSNIEAILNQLGSNYGSLLENWGSL